MIEGEGELVRDDDKDECEFEDGDDVRIGVEGCGTIRWLVAGTVGGAAGAAGEMVAAVFADGTK